MPLMSSGEPQQASGPPPSPPPPPRPGFFSRHRTAILTVGLVLYSAALAVAVADDVLHLGLFPTALERQARAIVARFDTPDEAARQAACEELRRDIEPFVAIPQLIRALGSGSPHVRAGAVECLRRLTKVRQGYDPAAPPAARHAAVARWRQWWKDNRQRY